jgi:uncharacterized protein YbcC (UPF0753/DUF2309 family)
VSERSDAVGWVDACRPLLPIQNPLWAFVHNNILLALEGKPFAEAVREAAALYRARPYESEDFYREQLRSGRIDRATLGNVLLASWPACEAKPASADEAVRRFLSEPWLCDDEPVVELVGGPSAEHLVRYSVRDRPLQDWLVPLIASYLDQGLAPWPNPYVREGLWAWFVASVESSPDFAMPWSANLRRRLGGHQESRRSVAEIVEAEVLGLARSEQAQAYCLQTLFVLKGWSGMVHKLETEPHLAPDEAPSLSLLEWLAVMLVSMHALDEWFDAGAPNSRAPVPSHYTHGLGRLRRWQDAYERTFGGQMLGMLERDMKAPQKPMVRRAQALVCMDDRIESLRRALESPRHGIETFGTVGFFGIDMNFHALGAGRPTRQCPPVVEPSRTIHELPVEVEGQEWARSRTAGRIGASLALLFYFRSRSMVRGLVVALSAGLLSFLPLLLKVLMPSRVHRMRSGIRRLVLPRPATRIDVDGPGGYSTQEQAGLVASILRASGLVRGFAPVVAVVSHGATTSNNPLRQAYGCGACSGNPGSPNSRLFALLANRAEIRARLDSLGIRIPPATVFVPFHHDTTTDLVEALDEHLVPLFARQAARSVHESLSAAARESAVERCRRFVLGSEDLSAERAFQYVQDRGHDLAQPRPEYGHNRVAACIVGRRARTQSSNLDRRSFLVSYDPTTDADGSVLRDAVLGTVPVAVNIAMDYYFSRVDNDGFGCGSKLPLNVASLLGVVTGSKSDLRIGLARQQVELHEPMRCMVLVEAPAQRVLDLFLVHPRLQRLVRGGWMRLGRIDPDDGAMELFVDGAFVAWRQAWPECGTVGEAEVPRVFDRRHDVVLEVPS